MIQTEILAEKPILFSEESYGGKRLGVIELNRQKILNALDTECYNFLEAKFERWAADSSVAAIVVHTRNERAFCAGGDVKNLILKIREQGLNYAKEFFTQEYFIDHWIHQFQKPMIVFADGITMGAGAGLMNGASHRIVTERTVFAMPEQAIGLFPDVGATSFLSRVPDYFGLFMGLTGARVRGADVVRTGLADFFMTSNIKRRVMADLLKLPLESKPENDHNIISQYLAKALPPPPVAQDFFDYQKHIWPQWQRIGVQPDRYEPLAHIIKHYRGDSAFLNDAKSRFQTGSPTSKRLFFEAYFRHQNKSITDVFLSEWQMAIQCSKEREFDEGVRALLIDKDSKPQWHPQHESEVQNLERFFQQNEPNDLARKLSQKGFKL
jgi:enoyl-CoA hydratase/carnithine racemase